MLLKAIARKLQPVAVIGAVALMSIGTAQARENWNGAPRITASAKAQQQARAQSNGLTAMALREAGSKRSRGQRVWCVPFARTASGINLQGNAKTWWHKAAGIYARGNAPRVGSVMTFQETRKLPLGHVAVVSQVVSPRKILIDHANWQRNKVSLGMAVVDVSPDNSWSAVRVESQPNTFGRVYPVKGFIYP